MSRVAGTEAHDGRTGLVVLTEGTIEGFNEASPFKARLYIDPSTWLPFAHILETTLNEEPVLVVATFEHDFVERGTLTDDFFEPAAIGYSDTRQ